MHSVKIIFPILVFLGAAGLTMFEIASFHRLVKIHVEEIYLKKRLIRRIIGLAFLMIASVLIFIGLNYLPPPTRTVYRDQAIVWAAVVGLVFLAVVLAVWDTIDNARQIGKLADQVTRENIENIKKILEKEERAKKK
jgi:hypothetical protein